MDNQRAIATLTKRNQLIKRVAFSERNLNQINAQYNRHFYKTSQKIDSLIQKVLHLHSVTIKNCFFQSADWINSNKWESLKQFQLWMCLIPKKTTIQMKKFPKLQYFKLYQLQTDLFIDFEGVSPHLKKIYLSWADVRYMDIDFRKMKSLQEIQIQFSLSDLSYKKLEEADLPHLQKLVIRCDVLKSIRYLSYAKWKSLKYLRIDFRKLTDQSGNNPFKNIAYSQFPELEQLSFLIFNQDLLKIQQIQKNKYNLKSLCLQIFKKQKKFLKLQSKLKNRFNEEIIIKY